MEPVSIEDIKRHLVLDQDDTGDDDYLTAMLLAARAGCEIRIGRLVADLNAGELAMLAHAVRLIVGDWWVNREIVHTDARSAAPELPVRLLWLLDPLRTFASR